MGHQGVLELAPEGVGAGDDLDGFRGGGGGGVGHRSGWVKESQRFWAWKLVSSGTLWE